MKNRTLFKIRQLFFVAIAAAFFSFGCASTLPLENWSNNHPDASKALGEWVQSHKPAAHTLFEWDGNHPDRSKEFVNWTINHPNLEVKAFVALHPGWPELNEILISHLPGSVSFMEWCRKYPQAAKDLMKHQGGLQWAGNHLYAEQTNMKDQ